MAMAATMKKVTSTISITGFASSEIGLRRTTESFSVLAVSSEGRLGGLTFPSTRVTSWFSLAKEVHHALEVLGQRPDE